MDLPTQIFASLFAALMFTVFFVHNQFPLLTMVATYDTHQAPVGYRVIYDLAKYKLLPLQVSRVANWYILDTWEGTLLLTHTRWTKS